MKYIDEFRKVKLIKEFSRQINKIKLMRQINIMEVCGTHTQSFFRFGLDKMLPSNLRLIAGPGCPVCVSSQAYIDAAIALANNKQVLILTFGDMLRVPGKLTTLEKERARFGNVHIVYSPWDSLSLARLNPGKLVVFLAVGFETTAPAIALTIKQSKKERLKNLFFFSSLKLITPAMKYLIRDERLRLDGFLCPGHVSAIIGTKPYEFIPKKYGIGCCVAGFEPLDIMEGIFLLLRQIVNKKPCVANQYGRVVKKSGNAAARIIMDSVFSVADASWRGLEVIPGSGLKINKDYAEFDAQVKFPHLSGSSVHQSKVQKQCKCGDVLKGLISPRECALFSKVCTPDNPVGPCMVSFEGACNAYYKYQR
jgi:hydrogenase expression/formation protein HypD